mmetsp:Transcript_622/g.2088  ORF Transcript_622/g.2088 Transcript_622/m.2088 type:complete len:265 (+) Transcript_622:30-824(+)|eukprot:CAMPEP_0198731820 /NCGR_PEP_ID=MMETSP1475-20131203/32314_1 /TAXON_ID= ORGANISM="Unidentified sp., Strain CCMP1999" /NCGR_SAMPLE_ID=MMETSP1475 /ASSEMBLY_ACC=CAM_ASM_001111 /LENGTH=264 /DNA_ID=CAMNT_0044494831 /DNA_START=14 /DNA_END=808 /DNA_ORIENTATION=+
MSLVERSSVEMAFVGALSVRGAQRSSAFAGAEVVCGRSVAAAVGRKRVAVVFASALEERPVRSDVYREGNNTPAGIVPAQKNKFIVRSARVDELDCVTDVRCKSFYSYLADDRYLYFQRKREIREVVLGRWRNPNAYCLVAVDQETMEVVGTCDATIHDFPRRLSFLFFPQGDESNEGKKIYVSSMAVRPDARRRGVAKTLLNKVNEVAKTLGVNEVFLHVEWENKPAVWLYQGCGFDRFKSMPPKWLRNMSRPEHTLMVTKVV